MTFPRTTIVFIDVVDSTDVGMIQGRGGAGLAPEAFERHPVLGEFVRQEFQSYVAAKLYIFGPKDNPHSPSIRAYPTRDNGRKFSRALPCLSPSQHTPSRP